MYLKYLNLPKKTSYDKQEKDLYPEYLSLNIWIQTKRLTICILSSLICNVISNKLDSELLSSGSQILYPEYPMYFRFIGSQILYPEYPMYFIFDKAGISGNLQYGKQAKDLYPEYPMNNGGVARNMQYRKQEKKLYLEYPN